MLTKPGHASHAWPGLVLLLQPGHALPLGFTAPVFYIIYVLRFYVPLTFLVYFLLFMFYLFPETGPISLVFKE